jgi:predicted nucleotidyltransferase
MVREAMTRDQVLTRLKEHQFLEVKEYLEGILERPVDLATLGALKRQFRDRILSEAIYP